MSTVQGVEELTVKEFNERFGVNSWGTPVYKMATKDDIGYYAYHQLGALPYFSRWHQSKEYISGGEGCSKTVKIIANKE